MPTVHAEADTSSILISPSTPVTQVAAVAPIAEAVSSQPTPMIIESASSSVAIPTPVTPIVAIPTASPVVETVSIPTVASIEPMIVTTPVQPMIASQPIPVINPEPVIAPTPVAQVAPTPVVTNSIFDSIMGNTEPAPTLIHQEIPVPAVAETPVAPTSTPVTAAFVPTPTSTPVPQAPTQTTATHNFTTPREFIEKSIVNIDNMLVNIDSRHSAKEIEEESYRIEKLRYTDLEKNAHTEKIIMDKERDHAIHMRKILETELERDTANKAIEKTSTNHVESTLTEIGTEHPVHRHAHKKTESHSHEENQVAA